MKTDRATKIIGYSMIAMFAALMLAIAFLSRSDEPPTLYGVSSSVPKEVGGEDMWDILARTSEKYGLPPSLIASVIRVESNWNAEAVSRTNHHGLMQIAPEVDGDWKDPEFNVNYGTGVLSYYIGRAKTDIANEGSVKGSSSPYEVGLAYYNAGRMGARTTDKGWAYAEKVLEYQRTVYSLNIVY